jgi:hypothetical protein
MHGVPAETTDTHQEQRVLQSSASTLGHLAWCCENCWPRTWRTVRAPGFRADEAAGMATGGTIGMDAVE